ncbi:hypothetical protein PV367_40085 [Streptomyces europaeiscabiei]|uniref:Uncharacterized protein n=1 Tax=Streptomyces europaeiscabiei TaxID=146819 RepID=A0AAJ2PYH1_9ACTN|nr:MULTISPECIES: hypothetical protein [Streptomyces]KFF96758.1 hypothetical protein IQ62_34750 [Streptomyces scabiei]MDX3135862.1 hypothetical protein [Streptomyces europaeiscabiei]
MLTARSSAEAHLYMDLHRCECGSGDFDRQHRLELHGDDLVAVYEGACGECGRMRRFTFRMSADIPPPAPAFGGAEPSQIIDPGEFAEVAFRISESAGIQILNTPKSEHHKMRGAVAYTVAAFEEIPKFIPSGENAVPASAFVSEVGKARYRREPRDFEREILEMNIANARAVLANIDKHSPRLGGTDSGE